MKTFFNTVQHVRDNWPYYRWIYQIGSKNYRNDFAFTIAIWIMNGFEKTSNGQQNFQALITTSMIEIKLLVSKTTNLHFWLLCLKIKESPQQPQ